MQNSTLEVALEDANTEHQAALDLLAEFKQRLADLATNLGASLSANAPKLGTLFAVGYLFM